MQQVFARAIGHVLQKIIASVHIFEEKMSSGLPICIWLFFENLPVLRLFGSPDGWHIHTDETLPETVDMGESGKIVLRDISRKSIFQHMLNNTLKAAWTITSAYEGEVIGVRLDFGLSIKPLVLNWGDELYIAERYPPDAEMEELLEVPIPPSGG